MVQRASTPSTTDKFIKKQEDRILREEVSGLFFLLESDGSARDKVRDPFADHNGG